MSTNDVPGHKPEHHDELAMGCWGEHDDGSLIVVESVEGGRVVYCMFDLAEDPIIEYRDAMGEGGFKKAFSWPTDTGDVWTWHDKTPFPWDRIMDAVRPGSRYAKANDLETAAQRVARHRKLHGQQFDYSQVTGVGARIRDKLQRAIGELRS